MTTTRERRTPTIASTTPMGMPASSRRGPCSMWSSTYDATARAGVRRAAAAGGPPPPARRRARVGPPGGDEPRARHRVHEPRTVRSGHLVDAALEQTAEGARAEEASVAPFLVAPRPHRPP